MSTYYMPPQKPSAVAGTDVLSLLGECQVIKDALLRDLDAIHDEPARLARYLQRPSENEIYTREWLRETVPKPSCEGESVAYRLWQFSRVLHGLVGEHQCGFSTGGCLSDTKQRPWYTYVILNTVPYGLTYEVGVHLFHSFGIVDLEHARRWYQFLRRQQGRAIDPSQSFIISQLIYRDWAKGRPTPDTIFRFSRLVNGRRPPESEDCIDLVVEDPTSDSPLKLVQEEKYPSLYEQFVGWKREAYVGSGPAFPGLGVYLENITQTMGIGPDEEWSLYAFPVPSFGIGQPKSGLYVRSQTEGMCKDIQRVIAFLLASTLWPIDYLQRRRFEEERRIEREDGRRVLLALTNDALNRVKQRLSDIDSIEFERGPQRALIRRVFQGLDEIAREGERPGSATLPMVRHFSTSLRRDFLSEEDAGPFAETRKTWEEKMPDDTLRHFLVQQDANSERVGRFCREVANLGNIALEFYGRTFVTSSLAKELAAALGGIVTWELGGTIMKWPFFLYDPDITPDRAAAHLSKRSAEDVTLDIEWEAKPWGIDVCLMQFLFEALFTGKRKQHPKSGRVSILSSQHCVWRISWVTESENASVRAEEIRFEKVTKTLTPRKVQDRLDFLRTIFRLPETMGSLEVKDGRADLVLDFSDLALLATPA